MFLIVAIFAAIVGAGVYTAEKPNPFAYTKVQRARLAHLISGPIHNVDPQEKAMVRCIVEQLELRLPYEAVVGPLSSMQAAAIKDAAQSCLLLQSLQPMSPDTNEIPAADPEAPSV